MEGIALTKREATEKQKAIGHTAAKPQKNCKLAHANLLHCGNQSVRPNAQQISMQCTSAMPPLALTRPQALGKVIETIEFYRVPIRRSIARHSFIQTTGVG